MGLIRVLLACSVLITHSEPIFGYRVMNGDMAITCFYIISGFLMFFILSESYPSKAAFYVNRFLRIYPAYYIAAFVSIFVYALIPGSHHNPLSLLQQAISRESWTWIVWSAVSNASLIGMDLTRYIQVNQDLSICVPNFLCERGGGGHNMLLVPQAWTLAIEFTFYIIAPFIIRMRTVFLVVLVSALIVAKFYCIDLLKKQGIRFDEESFFLFQLSYFLMGGIAYRALVAGRAVRLNQRPLFYLSCAGTLLALLLIFNAKPIMDIFRTVHFIAAFDLNKEAFYAIFAATVPLQFVFASSVKVDKYIGDLSYPIYIFHYAVAKNALIELPVFDVYRGEVVLATTILLSLIYNLTFDRRIQRIRARISAQARAALPLAPPAQPNHSDKKSELSPLRGEA
jgi:peptidoglycan/LPS O-acetylase OafA/YrhL